MRVAIDNQVCFHRRLFSNSVKPGWCIAGPVEQLGSTNQNQCGVKLLPKFVWAYPLDCVHLCHLPRAWHHYLCPNGRESLHSAYPPTPTTAHLLSPTHRLIHDTHDIKGVVKNYLKNKQ